MQTETSLYFDHAATTPVAEEVREAMIPYLSERFHNASSVYAGARQVRKAIDEARESLAAASGVRPEEIIFTSGGTEADNLAIKGAAWHMREQGRDGIVVSAIEHHAVLDSARWLGRFGFRVAEVPVTRDGIVRLDALEEAVDERTAVVSLMWANNEIGTIQPVARAAQIAREAGALFHTDAVQALPWMEVDAGAADLAAFAAHKLYGPKGVGALTVRRGVKIQALLHGGGQERGLRSSTYNAAAIVGFGSAAALAVAGRSRATRVAGMRDRLERSLCARLTGVHVNGAGAERLPNNLNVSLEGVESDSLILLLDGAGVAASSGSACASGALEPSYVLLAIGRPKELAAGALRLTLGRETTEAEVDAVVERIAAAVDRLRGRSR
jgi:cysteine desulfurase